MVRRFFPGAHIAVDADIDQAVAGLRRQQQMVDPQSLVFLPGAGLIIPECVLAGRVGDGAQRVGQAEAEQRLEAFAGGGRNRASLTQAAGLWTSCAAGMTLKSPASTSGSSAFKPLLRILKKPRHPFEFIRIFLGVRRVAVGQIKAGDPQHAALERHHAFQKPGMDVFVVAGKPRLGFVERQLGQQRDAVEGLLAVGDHVVAERLDGLPREMPRRRI